MGVELLRVMAWNKLNRFHWHLSDDEGWRVEIDAYPGLKLKGHVESLGAGTGSEFSILPAQNASGNWVKVTQRVPVRIAIDEKSSRPLLAGLTVTTTVFFGDGNSAKSGR